MSIQSILIAAFIALGFVGWPIIGKLSGASGAWVGTLTMTGATLAVGLLSMNKLTASVPTGRAFLYLTIASLLNGLAVYFYSMKTASPEIPTAVFVVTVSVLMVVFAPILDWGLNGATPGWRQMAGFLCAVAAIYLLGG